MGTELPLEGHKILITGAAGGIGEAIARRCADDGARIALVDRDPAVKELARTLDGTAFVGDVTDQSFVEETVGRAVDDLGDLHGLANVAGIQRSGDVTELGLDDWAAILAVNLTAPFLWCRFAIPAMLDTGGGSIVNIGSVAATHAIRNSVAYVASKHGLLGLTRSISTDYGRRGIRCNTVSPGSIETDLLADYVRQNPEAGRRLIDANFAGRFGRPEEIAGGCAYLFSEGSAFVNGADLCIDGGRTAAT